MKMILPTVISAGKIKDIPASCYSPLLTVLMDNAFPKKRKIPLRFKKLRHIVFWTRNPARGFVSNLVPYLSERNITWSMNFLLNDYEQEKLEPHCHPLEERIESFHVMNALNPGKIIWRIDPLLVTPRLDVMTILSRLETIAGRLYCATKHIVFDFLRHDRDGKGAHPFSVPNEKEKRDFITGIAHIAEKHGLSAACDPAWLAAFPAETAAMRSNREVEAAFLPPPLPRRAVLPGVEMPVRDDLPPVYETLSCFDISGYFGSECQNGCLYCQWGSADYGILYKNGY